MTFDNYDCITFHAEADVIVAEGHTIDPFCIIMIGGTRIQSECLA